MEITFKKKKYTLEVYDKLLCGYKGRGLKIDCRSREFVVVHYNAISSAVCTNCREIVASNPHLGEIVKSYCREKHISLKKLAEKVRRHNG